MKLVRKVAKQAVLNFYQAPPAPSLLDDINVAGLLEISLRLTYQTVGLVTVALSLIKGCIVPYKLCSVCASMSIMEFKPFLSLNSVVAILRTLMAWPVSRQNKLLLLTVISKLCVVELSLAKQICRPCSQYPSLFTGKPTQLRTGILCEAEHHPPYHPTVLSLVYFLQSSQHTRDNNSMLNFTAKVYINSFFARSAIR
ncbi:hypothetical protein IMY05_C4818000100 [Salix suchowensis]|nr:hypothetical protein IMY05_C4818000100 [Salix suchowensis]